MSNFEPISDLRIGHIVEVSGSTVRAELSGDVAELTRSYGGRVYPIGQIGSVVKIHFGRRLVFGFVTLLRMRSEEIILGSATPIPPDADQRVMEIELFAEGTWNRGGQSLAFSRGVSIYPLPRQNVHILTREEAQILYQAAEGSHQSENNPLVPFATYTGADNTECRANIDKMFGLHCAILGSTGSGKSAAVASLLQGVLRHKLREGVPTHPRIILIDPHGEYGNAFTKSSIVYRAYDPIGTDETTGEQVKLPYWLMSAEEFRLLVIGKTEEEATSQNNIVYKALTHSRMVAAKLAEPAPTAYGVAAPADNAPIDEPRARPGVDPGALIDFDRDKPRPFSITEFINHITYAQAARVKGAATEKIPDSEFSSKYKSILDKISVLRRDPRIRFLMDEWSEESEGQMTLELALSQFIGPVKNDEQNQSIRIIDISGLPNEVAGPLAALLARLLFQYKLHQTRLQRTKDPVLLVCEEAHRYVPDRGEAEYSAAQSAIRRIAREGRKYGLGLMLVSQRPADIESTVIAQCGTWLVLRLTNSADQQHVARFLPDGLSGITRSLPALAQQEAIFVGEGSALPAKIRINDLSPDERPRSENVSFADGWAHSHLEEEEIKEIAERMSGQLPGKPA